ncbi:hypothetical protein RMATCC62417_16585 [Rhizopus microsporus]|nr:hypothetical protein RMATCC62417_16585 [Rhizopus microsporus]
MSSPAASGDYFESTSDTYLSTGPYFTDDPIPRSTSPDSLPMHPHDGPVPPLREGSRGSNDTMSSDNFSITTPPVTTESQPIPVKKPKKRLSNVFNNGFFGSLKMTPASPTNQSLCSQSPDMTDRRFSGASIHSSSSVNQRQTIEPSECDLFKDFTAPERQCLAGMMDPDPKTRWTVDQALESAWMTQIEICENGKLSNGFYHTHYCVLK